MNKIYKYQLEMTPTQCVELPLRAEILTVKVQGDKLYLWAVVNTSPNAIKKNRRIEIVNTDDDMPIGDLKYISSFPTDNDTLTFHVFENI